MKNLIGKRLDGRYEFLELIGVGGMANVYKAYDSLKRCDVAIKVLKEKFSSNEEFIYRFKNESKANASLSHPNIVRVFDVGFGNRMQYIVMEYIEGVTLKEFIERARVLNWKDVVHFTFQILRGLQHAHDKGIVHRDMKPQNVMLLEDGTVKIMDFGIARFPRDEKINFKKAVGSAEYISPEQAVGGVTDCKSDIYSVGIMMYEMLTGQLPFNGKTPEIIANKQVNEVVKSPLQINPNLPQGLVDIIMRAIKKNPQERYQSADEMLRDVDEFKQNPNISFGYSYLQDIENTKYFGVSAVSLSSRDVLSRRDILSNNVKVKNSRRRKNNLVPIFFGVAGAFFLVAVVLVSTFLFGRRKGGAIDITIPDFVGVNVEDIRTMENAKYKDLEFTVEYKSSPKDPVGVVLSQSVPPGTQVKSNYSGLVLCVSSGVTVKEIPNVIGLMVTKAESKLKKAGFINIKKVEKVDEKFPFNSVIAIDPKVSTKVAYDTPITLYCNISEKDEKVADVPSVVGKSLEEAKSILKTSGFDVSVKETSDSSKPSDVVISQNRNKATIGSTIEVVLNVVEGKKYKKFEGDVDDDVLDVKEKPKEKQASGKIEVPLTSYVKLKDTFHVSVIDSAKNILSECEFNTSKDSSIFFEDNSTKNCQYKVLVKNNRNGVVKRYGVIDVSFYGGRKKISSNMNPNVFEQTIEQKKEKKDVDAWKQKDKFLDDLLF